MCRLSHCAGLRHVWQSSEEGRARQAPRNQILNRTGGIGISFILFGTDQLVERTCSDRVPCHTGNTSISHHSACSILSTGFFISVRSLLVCVQREMRAHKFDCKEAQPKSRPLTTAWCINNCVLHGEYINHVVVHCNRSLCQRPPEMETYSIESAK